MLEAGVLKEADAVRFGFHILRPSLASFLVGQGRDAAPGWAQEWQSNLAALSVRGGISDPGPTSLGGHGLANVISLQSMVSVFRDDPRVYNSVSYLVCAPLLIAWAAVTLRSRNTQARTWLALAGVAALTMLPVYHRQYDAKLLLLAIPACAMLWAKGGLAGRLSLFVRVAALVFTGDLTWAVFLALVQRLPLSPAGISGQLLTSLQVFPAPLSLLVLGIFYLVVYARKPDYPRRADRRADAS